jgi:hypothetical protein
VGDLNVFTQESVETGSMKHSIKITKRNQEHTYRYCGEFDHFTISSNQIFNDLCHGHLFILLLSQQHFSFLASFSTVNPTIELSYESFALHTSSAILSNTSVTPSNVFAFLSKYGHCVDDANFLMFSVAASRSSLIRWHCTSQSVWVEDDYCHRPIDETCQLYRELFRFAVLLLKCLIRAINESTNSR